MTTINCLENDWERGARKRKSADQQNVGVGFERLNMSKEAVREKSGNAPAFERRRKRAC